MSDLKGIVQKTSSKDVIVLNGDVSKTDDTYINFWIRVVSIKNKQVAIRKVKSYKGSTKTITLDSSLPFTPEVEKDEFTISELKDLKSNLDATVLANSTKLTLILSENAKKVDNVYKDYWIKINNNIRRVKDYKNNTITLDYDLPNAPNTGDAINIYAHFFNDYIILGIDFTNIGGTDLSGLIDIVGGVLNFQILTVASSICCCLVCLICIFIVTSKKGGGGSGGGSSGLVIPGIGKLNPRQPLVIQMPMQTAPYPFPNSPFPRDT